MPDGPLCCIGGRQEVPVPVGVTSCTGYLFEMTSFGTRADRPSKVLRNATSADGCLSALSPGTQAVPTNNAYRPTPTFRSSAEGPVMLTQTLTSCTRL